MIIGTVKNSVWATRKMDSLNGLKLMVVEIEDNQLTSSSIIIAIDMVGAGSGERVLVTTGSAARVVFEDSFVPIDAAIVGIIDSIKE